METGCVGRRLLVLVLAGILYLLARFLELLAELVGRFLELLGRLSLAWSISLPAFSAGPSCFWQADSASTKADMATVEPMSLCIFMILPRV